MRGRGMGRGRCLISEKRRIKSKEEAEAFKMR